MIVSLTSFPPAVKYAVEAIRSILAGSVLPDKIVLYVTLEQFGPEGLPPELLKLVSENPIVEVRDYPRDIRSYRKLVPALRDFPDEVIVTIDDDVKYHRHLLRDLLRWHRKFPKDIVAHRVKRIFPDKGYRKWRKYRWYHFLAPGYNARFDNLQTGVGGVLYPPHALKEEMIDEDLFTRIAPTADDLWFWAAAVANGRRIVPVKFGHNKPRGLGKPRELALKKVNFKGGTDRNKEMFDAILREYPQIKKMLENEL